MNGKSKLVVPVIAIMMCSVALVGVAYAAYTSTVTDNGNNIDITTGEFVLEVYNSAQTPAVLSGPITLEQLMVVSTAHVVGNPGSVVATVNASDVEYVAQIVITSSNIEDTHATIACADIPDIPISTVTGAASSDITISVDVAFYSDSECQTPLVNNTVQLSGTTTIYYKITVSSSGAATFNNNSPLTDANNVMTALADQTFDLAFTATSVTPSP